MAVIGLPSAPAAVPARVCRSVVIRRQAREVLDTEVRRFHTTLTNASVQDLGQNLVLSRLLNGIVLDKLHWPTKFAD